MESLAYLHLAVAYETPSDLSSDLGSISLPLKLFEGLKRHNPIARTCIQLLSLSLPLAVLNAVNTTLLAVQIEDSVSEVTSLQKNLKTVAYYDGPITGYYGSLTQEAVKRFQKAKGLVVDGIVGEATLAALKQDLDGTSTGSIVFSVVKRGLRTGDRGAEVKEIQQRLKAAGFDPGEIDENFGTETEDAVRKFQSTKGLFVDGIVGKETWFTLRFIGSSISPYLVIVTPDSADTFSKVLTMAPNAYLDKFSTKSDIYAGGFPNLLSAKKHSDMLRSQGLQARVEYIR